jgi:hypothetical protein
VQDRGTTGQPVRSPWHPHGDRTLLSATIRGPLDERLQNRILGEAAGNPLALARAAARARSDRGRGQLAARFRSS